MKKAIIYYRKSTDRDDKQANSLEHQLWNCIRTAKNYELDVIDEIWESKSAKLEWTRDWFNKLLKLCKTWKIDYIIIDEPKRLSRNNLDIFKQINEIDTSTYAIIITIAFFFLSISIILLSKEARAEWKKN